MTACSPVDLQPASLRAALQPVPLAPFRIVASPPPPPPVRAWAGGSVQYSIILQQHRDLGHDFAFNIRAGEPSDVPATAGKPWHVSHNSPEATLVSGWVDDCLQLYSPTASQPTLVDK